MALDKDKLPAMYRRLFEVMRGNGYYGMDEIDNKAARDISSSYRITKADVFKIKRELLNNKSKD